MGKVSEGTVESIMPVKNISLRDLFKGLFSKGKSNSEITVANQMTETAMDTMNEAEVIEADGVGAALGLEQQLGVEISKDQHLDGVISLLDHTPEREFLNRLRTQIELHKEFKKDNQEDLEDALEEKQEQQEALQEKFELENGKKLTLVKEKEQTAKQEQDKGIGYINQEGFIISTSEQYGRTVDEKKERVDLKLDRREDLIETINEIALKSELFAKMMSSISPELQNKQDETTKLRLTMTKEQKVSLAPSMSRTMSRSMSLGGGR